MNEAVPSPKSDQPLPPAAQLHDNAHEPVVIDPSEPFTVFKGLVSGDGDLVGLVAYSIHKQHKHDWLRAYARDYGRMPNATEAQSYLFGEGTKRRLATYRQLAEALLDDCGPVMPGAPARLASASPRIGIARDRSNVHLSARAIVGLCVVLCVVLVALIILFWMTHGDPPSTIRGGAT